MRRTALLATLVASLVLSCSEGAAGPAPARQAAPPAAPTLPTSAPATTTRPVPAPVSLLTGLPADVGAPVLCVKIDNAPAARPPAGLDLADVVYVEPVEGGLSRLLAVFQSQLPSVAGPVRSVRQSDLELVANFGRPALAFSGEAAALRPLIDQAPVLDVSAPVRPGAYHRDYGRPTPHNLFAETARLGQGGAPARDIGFRFGPPPPGGRPTPSTTVRYTATQIGLQWVPAESRWVVSMDGAPLTTTSGARPGAATIVLQRVAVHETNIRDAAGTPSPFAVTVGTGAAVVLRDGRAFTGQWSRPTPQAGTTFTLPGGAPLTFAPGRVWVVLVPA
ncbi:MAG TPA: DUF3048 domain-containing protein [Pseudonocardiaceae bacterium]|jgi:hypothetical protein|nr:DUF3048 domain-containing protein [Pseudonocardiaceae bacterium]